MGGGGLKKIAPTGDTLNYFTNDPKKLYERAKANAKDPLSRGQFASGALQPTDEEYGAFDEKVAATEQAEIDKIEAPAREAEAKETSRKDRLLSGKRAGRRSTMTGAGLGGNTFQGKRRTLLGG